MWRQCAYEGCGRWFETENVRRLFCSERCRRSGQNAARREARAEAREARSSAQPMADPWAFRDPDDWTAEEVWANALLDALPPGVETAPDAVCPAAYRSSSGKAAEKSRPSGSGTERRCRSVVFPAASDGRRFLRGKGGVSVRTEGKADQFFPSA